MQTAILDLAIAKGELDKFLAGDPPYFFEARSEYDEPQNFDQAFDLLVLPYWERTRDAQFPQRFSAALNSLLEHYPDCTRAIYVA